MCVIRSTIFPHFHSLSLSRSLWIFFQSLCFPRFSSWILMFVFECVYVSLSWDCLVGFTEAKSLQLHIRFVFILLFDAEKKNHLILKLTDAFPALYQNRLSQTVGVTHQTFRSVYLQFSLSIFFFTVLVFNANASRYCNLCSFVM